jgi:hypothetical protein
VGDAAGDAGDAGGGVGSPVWGARMPSPLAPWGDVDACSPMSLLLGSLPGLTARLAGVPAADGEPGTLGVPAGRAAPPRLLAG